MGHCSTEFLPLNIAVLTVSDTRTFDNDTSGQFLVDAAKAAGHNLIDRALLKDNLYDIRAKVAHWAAQDEVHAILITGGTGFTDRDSTPEAVSCLFDKTVEGFGELFRQISFSEIGTSTIQSRALAGISNHTLIVCLPGSTNACRTAWVNILKDQLDSQGSCNFVTHLLKKPACHSRG